MSDCQHHWCPVTECFVHLDPPRRPPAGHECVEVCVKCYETRAAQ